ncbi:MAG: Asp-tRNA(Asn)/Glu-tRNA(Gln) amidotransferase subunit GatB [candidate division WOR-3 bacterium]
MDDFIVNIGVEAHIQIKTKSKIFCRCSTEFTEEPNRNVCPICMGMPGVMPTLNFDVVPLAVKTALALNCEINRVSGFARKNYFYPDLPKGYQITQHEYPLAKAGSMKLKSGKVVRIRRLHLEEDTGKMIHDQDENSLLDFNRAGVPLIEIVTEPDFNSEKEVVEYLENLQRIVRYLDVSTANMEFGELRGEPNISLRRVGDQNLGVKTEIKNLNSFRSIEKGIVLEIERQKNILSRGESVVSVTMLFDEKKQELKPMRKKENISEYRYFPEPDLPDLLLSDEFIESIKKEMVELPDQKFERIQKEYCLNSEEAEIIVSDKDFAEFFEKSVKGIKNIGRITKFFIREIPSILKEKKISVKNLNFNDTHLNKLFKMIDEEKINLNFAQDILKKMSLTGDDPENIIKSEGENISLSENEIEKMVKEVLEENQKEVQRYKNGEEKLFGFLVGQCMKKAKNRANPKLINEILKRCLNDRR